MHFLLGLILLTVPTDTLSASFWSAAVDARSETFVNDLPPGREVAVTVGRHATQGALLVSLGRVDRFDEATATLTLDGYRTLAPRTYLNARFRWAEDARVLPQWDALAEVYRGVGVGVEVSAGYRVLVTLDDRVQVLQGSASWTDDTWLASLRASVAPGFEDATIGVSGAVRRFFGPPGPFAPFVELRAGREREITPFGVPDVASVFEEQSVTLRGQGPLPGPLGFRVALSRVDGSVLRRLVGEAGLVARF